MPTETAQPPRKFRRYNPIGLPGVSVAGAYENLPTPKPAPQEPYAMEDWRSKLKPEVAPTLFQVLNLTETQVEAAIERNDGKIYMAAKELCITDEQIEQIVKDSPNLRAMLRLFKKIRDDKAELRIEAIAEDVEHPKHYDAVTKILQTQGKERGWVERIETKEIPSKEELRERLLAEMRRVHLLPAAAEDETVTE